jgi:hypothetical protein
LVVPRRRRTPTRARRIPSRESEIADLELAVRVDEEVTGFEVPVEDGGGVDVFETAEGLVEEGLEVGVGEGLAGADDGVEVGFHEFFLCDG